MYVDFEINFKETVNVDDHNTVWNAFIFEYVYFYTNYRRQQGGERNLKICVLVFGNAILPRKDLWQHGTTWDEFGPLKSGESQSQ